MINLLIIRRNEKIFNRTNLKLSYSYNRSIEKIIINPTTKDKRSDNKETKNPIDVIAE